MTEEQVSKEEVREEEVTQTSTKKNKKTPKRRGGGVLALLALIVIIGLGVFYVQRNNSPVAMVNGEKITRSDYQKLVKELERNWQVGFEEGAYPIAADSEEVQSLIKNEAMENLISQSLMLTAAREAGVQVSESEVNEVIDMYKASAGSEAAFREDLKAAALTESVLRDRIRTELIVRAYVEMVTPAELLAVSDEEVQELYEMNSELIGDSMTLEEFSDVYTSEIEMSKLNEALEGILLDFRSRAEVEYLIDLPEVQQPTIDPSLLEQFEVEEEIVSDEEITSDTEGVEIEEGAEEPEAQE